MKKLIPTVIILAILVASCSQRTVTGRPQVIYKVSDSVFIIKGNAKHFQQRADWKAKQKVITKN